MPLITAINSSGMWFGGIDGVIFIIDNLKKKLHEIVLAGLQEAEKNQLSSVTLPTLRMGVMLGVVEKTEEEAIEEMAMAIHLFKGNNPAYVKNITFVVYSNQNILRKLTAKFESFNT